MKTSEIARAVLASPSIVPPGVLREQLGHEGYLEAMRRGWIAPDTEFSGSMKVSSRRDRREEMQEAAKDGAPAPVANAQIFGGGLPGRGFFGESASPVIQLNTVEPRDTQSPAAAPAAPGPSGAPANAPGKSAQIGDQVTVAENGQTYSARVAGRESDGKLKLSFSGSKPGRDTFADGEVRVTATVPPAGTPAATR